MSPKSQEELKIMQEGGKKLAQIRDELLAYSVSGVTLLAIEAVATSLIEKTGGTPSFTTVDGYKWATCLCVNDVVVHGVPTQYLLKQDDMLTIDVGLLYKELHTDTAWTKTIVSKTGETQKLQKHAHFRETGERALSYAIDQARVGKRIGHISRAIQETIEGAGYHVIRALVGHGVGRLLHEDPQVPGILRGDINGTPELIPGMTIAIEVIYAEGDSSVVYKGNDGWSIATRDGSLSAVYEHTVAITPDGPLVLTKGTK